MTKLKTISDLATAGGPIYYRFQAEILAWKNAYEKRNKSGDINVIKFLEHFGEIDKTIENES